MGGANSCFSCKTHLFAVLIEYKQNVNTQALLLMICPNHWRSYCRRLHQALIKGLPAFVFLSYIPWGPLVIKCGNKQILHLKSNRIFSFERPFLEVPRYSHVSSWNRKVYPCSPASLPGWREASGFVTSTPPSTYLGRVEGGAMQVGFCVGKMRLTKPWDDDKSLNWGVLIVLYFEV